MDKKKILLIDDEAMFCRLIKRHLEAIADFEVEVALDGREGLTLAKLKRPDLIVLDIIMPGLTGFQVLEKLKQDEKTMLIPVVMLSGKDDPIYKDRASRLYDEMYLTKPVDAYLLRDKINEVLRIREKNE
ncbi:MAG: response regulator [Candidatus Omnitrophica bacterium]|nr:response regulator [Candidatus Omnitrophota bacterium]